MQLELDSAIKSIKSKKNILILGPEKIGKSSFLLSIEEKLKQSKSTTPVIFPTEQCIDLISYIKRNTLNLLNAYKDIFPKPKELFSLSMLDIDKKLSELKISDKTKQSLKLLLLFEHDPQINMEDVLKTFFTLPQIISAEAKTTSVVLIDDAELLQNLKSDKTSASFFFELLKSGELSGVFVLASSFRLPIEGLEEIALKPLSLEQTRDLLASVDLKLDEKALNTIYNFAEGIPFYINYFGRIIKQTNKTDSSSITESINDSLSNDLHIYFSEKLKQLSPKELPILFCMAEHKVNTPSRISKLLNYSQTNVRRFLSIMEEKGFVTLKQRGVFEIHDPVFRRWLEQQSRS
jgi:hypothetical protein